MSRKVVYTVIVTIALIISACNLLNSTPPATIPTNTVVTAVEVTSTQPSARASEVPTYTPSSIPISPTATAPAVSTATTIPVSVPASTNYIDDRSTPSQVIVSFYNAINRQEYTRAYGYWSNPSTSLGGFTSFENGYHNTISVDLVFGLLTGDAGMSQVYYSVPVILKVSEKNNLHSNYAACYVVHQSSPGVFGAPPFQPMSIDRGSAKISAAGTSDAAALATACNDFPVGAYQVLVSSGSLNIDKANFVDNRSGAIETVSSLLNAINLKQYVRAYSYFQDPATFPGSYDPYAAGYTDTASITVAFGAVQNEGAAGSLILQGPIGHESAHHYKCDTNLCWLLYLALISACSSERSAIPTTGNTFGYFFPGG